MKNKKDYCEIDHVEKKSTLKSLWTKLTTIVFEIAALIGAIDAIVELINYILLLFK
nr:hypothetical protein [uncultured Flavobacterium sp.]